ncbi:MAG: ABC transporter permease [Methanobacteriaceae archaeon]|jgi:ABC-type nitrate/sulfonate/bicarbonate transport system permease component
MERKLSYESKGLNLLIRELSAFFRSVATNNFTLEFFTVLMPILILWEMLPRLGVVPATLMPPPTVIAVTFKDLILNHDLLGHVSISMLRFLLGLSIAILTAVPIGVLMGWNLFIRKHALPLFQMLAPIPPPAWVPITIILLGIGLPMQVFLVFLGAFYPVLFDTYQGIKDIDPRYIASARVFGASEFTLIKKVYLPNALSFIVMGIKIGIVLGLVMLVVSEMVGAHSGIGWLLVESKDFFRIDRMVVSMLTLGFIGWFFIEIMKYIESRLALWKVGR